MTQRKADLLIAAVSMAWGSSYLLMKMGLNGIEPFTLIALRFGLAFLVTGAIFYKRISRWEQRTVGYSALLGVLLFGVFTALLYGLKTESVSSAGFLTSTTVIFVPVLQAALSRKMPELTLMAGVLVIMGGVGLLTIGDTFIIEESSLLCLAGAFFYAVHIIVTNAAARTADTLQLGILQLGFTALYGLCFAFLLEVPALPSSVQEWFAILGLALVCSAFGFVMQPVAQKFTTPERTGVLFALEPVFSALFGFLFLKEVLSFQGYTGALLVLGGVLVASLGKGKPATDNNLY